MASTNKQNANSKPKRPQKIFGVMTKRRWFGVAVFLSAMLWSYTAGPPLEDSVVCNRYFLDGSSYDYKTIAFEGNIELIDSLFQRGFWPDVFTWQIGSYFEWTEGPVWSPRDHKLYFSDTKLNKVFSWSSINGVQIEVENGGHCEQSHLDTLSEPGPNGLVLHPDNPNAMFIAQHGLGRIILMNMVTKEHMVIADKYNGKRFNSPNDMIVGPEGKYLYFSDPPYGLTEKGHEDPKDPNHFYVDKKSAIGFSGVYRVKLDGTSAVELLDKSMKRPNGILLLDKKRMLISDCIDGEFRVNVFSVAKGGSIKLKEQWTEKSILKNSKSLSVPVSPLGSFGCVDGMAKLNEEYIVTTCPGGKLCIIDSKKGELKALIKMADLTVLSNVAVSGEHLYVTGNHTVWQLKLQDL